jgi:hypothetical protein
MKVTCCYVSQIDDVTVGRPSNSNVNTSPKKEMGTSSWRDHSEDLRSGSEECMTNLKESGL